MSIEAIAQARHVQGDTVESYLAECITAGFAYDWQRMNIPDAMRDRIQFGLAHLLSHRSASEEQVSPTHIHSSLLRPSSFVLRPIVLVQEWFQRGQQ